MTQLFPQTFRRCRVNYELRAQISVRAEFDEWQFLLGRQIRAPIQLQMPPYRNEFISPMTANPTPITQFNTQANLNTPNATFFTPSLGLNSGSPAVRTWGGEDSLSLLSLALSIPTENWLASFLDSVPIRPTGQEIENGSELVQSSNIEADVICTICQEHEQSPINSVWRRLRGCMHSFHQSCIDRWFTRNSHCPVCRADIRAQTQLNPSLAPSPMESDSTNSPM